MTVYFTGDTHYHHRKVIEYCARPFVSPDHMNAEMVDRWNSVVGAGDLVYHLGDFSLGSVDEAIEVVRALKGNKYLIWGNHDKALRKSTHFRGHWIWCEDLKSISPEGENIVLCHYALRTWSRAHHGSWQLHGHSHGSLTDLGGRQADVGVDCWDYSPVALGVLRDRFALRTFEAVDHHREA